MPDQEPTSHSPAVMAGVVFVVQLVGLGLVGASGALARLPPAIQFFLGLEAFGFPILIYFLMKKRQQG